jgi:hypothetical protein
MEYRIGCAETDERREKEQAFTGLGLTSRKNLCLHPSVRMVYYMQDVHLILLVQVSKEKKGRAVDARCRDLTCASACEKGRANPGSVPLCDWHEVRTLKTASSRVFSSIWSGFERPRTWPFDSIWYLDPCRHNGTRQSKRHLPLLYYSTNGSLPNFGEGTSPHTPIADAVRRRRYLLVPLPIRSQGGGTSLERVVKRRDCGI